MCPICTPLPLLRFAVVPGNKISGRIARGINFFFVHLSCLSSRQRNWKHIMSQPRMLYKKKGFFLGLFSFTSKCNFLSGEVMNAKNPEKKPITKVLLPTHA